MLNRPLTKRTTEERKALVENISREIKNGKTIQEACDLFGVKRSTYSSWLGDPLHRKTVHKKTETKPQPVSLQTIVVPKSEPSKMKFIYFQGTAEEAIDLIKRF